mgnify:CR=1 FL=1
MGSPTFLPLERQPIVVLNIKGDPYLTDVNVHPSKQQIRLSKEKELLELVHDTIRRAIQTAVRAPVIEKPKPAKQAPSRQLDLWKRPVEETVRHQPEPLSSMDWKQDKLQERVEARRVAALVAAGHTVVRRDPPVDEGDRHRQACRYAMRAASTAAPRGSFNCWERTASRAPSVFSTASLRAL